MSGAGGWREGSRYRMAAASSTPFSSQGYLRDHNSTREEAENPQKLTTSEEEQRGQASVYQQQQEQYVRPYVLITPNETRRNQLQQIAKKELDDLERWKEEHRPGPIKLAPQRLGGKESEAQARQKQQMMLIQSKYQQKHKREEYVNAKKAAEEAKILKQKAIQREKTRSHTYKQALREDENRRLEEMKQEQRRKAELMEFKQKQEEEARMRAHQNEQRRVNNAFLDRLQNKTQPNSINQPGYSGSLDYLSNGAWGPNYLE
ncbi:epithelial-stromal interaction protein 1 isoform X2 [Grus americana]|uniref:epithelial-stromal interaction protein 1 isoform X2 n=1 Tax=Grus americana TaxID=9117 RepID=UPI002407BDEC|nr:epithelial-stromal interaction protein 1 isoform X2 [Grus americana]